MAKVLDTFAAVERYVLRRDGRVDDGMYPDVPEDAMRHAVLIPDQSIGGTIVDKVLDAREPVFDGKGRSLEAACGRRVKVYLPQPFDSEDASACPQCMEVIGVRGG